MMDREVMEAFRLFDRNMDGRITSKEITDLIGSLGGDSSCPHVQVGQTCQSKSVQG
jgi:Ca2+-binding EF-hand superfamily protein